MHVRCFSGCKYLTSSTQTWWSLHLLMSNILLTVFIYLDFPFGERPKKRHLSSIETTFEGVDRRIFIFMHHIYQPGNQHTVDGRTPANHLLFLWKPMKHGIFSGPQLVFSPDFWLPSMGVRWTRAMSEDLTPKGSWVRGIELPHGRCTWRFLKHQQSHRDM